MSDLAVIVLAAGRSRRMKSPTSKVLHRAAGRPLVHYPICAAREVGVSRVSLVVSPDDRDVIVDYVAEAFADLELSVGVQDPPRGTGDAARVGLEALGQTPPPLALILCGDVPLVDGHDLGRLIEVARGGRLAFATCQLDDPTGYGRIVRSADGRVRCVVEERDLDGDEQRAIDEVNAGLYCVATEPLRRALANLSTDNAQGEYYLTDIVAALAADAEAVSVSPDAMLGVNDREQLARAEDVLFERIARRHRAAGSTIARTARIDDAVQIEPDAIVRDGVHLRGNTKIGGSATIDVGCVVDDGEIGERAVLLPYTVVTRSRVGKSAQLGPFTHVRPDCELEEGVRLGNFVETKKVVMRAFSKANHLSYLGDGDVGERTNVGAGTIFCNYDGFSKHRTSIGRDVFIGSDSQLIAPVRVGDGAYVATASSITEDVPEDAFVIGRARQNNKPGRAVELKARLLEQKLARKPPSSE